MSGPIPFQTLSRIFETLTRAHVDEWVAAHRIEDLTLDFKRAPKFFETSDERQVLAKAISGFGNAGGGLIVWGVRAVKDADGLDAAQAVEPIEDPTRFLSNLTSYSGSAVSPTIAGVVHRLVDDSSVAVTLVPEQRRRTIHGEPGRREVLHPLRKQLHSVRWSTSKSPMFSIGDGDLMSACVPPCFHTASTATI